MTARASLRALAPATLTMLVLATSAWLAPGVAQATPSPATNGPHPPAVADDPPITPGSGFQSFSWPGGGTPFDAEGPFTYSAAAPSVVTVTDAFCKGDQFQVFDNGVAIGTTSSVPVDSSCGVAGTTSDPDVAVHDIGYSHESFLLPAGNHSITIQTIVNPFPGGGAAFLRVDTCTVFTPDANGILTGTDGPDVICGTAGNDRIAGLGGDDLIFAFAGNDQISAGDGNDTVFAGSGNDMISGGAGNDVLDGQQGDDQVVGGDGDDALYGGTGTNQLSGGTGTDTCRDGTTASCELP
ncbi:MAG: calcium-binding protein [Acidimicrobiales bacterium]